MDTALVMSALFLNISFARCKDLMLTKMVLICKYEWKPLVCPGLLLVCFVILYRRESFRDFEYISLGIVAFLEWKYNCFLSWSNPAAAMKNWKSRMWCTFYITIYQTFIDCFDTFPVAQPLTQVNEFKNSLWEGISTNNWYWPVKDNKLGK